MIHTPGPWSVGDTRVTQSSGLKHIEVPVHVGRFGVSPGRGNCFAIVYMGGRGAISQDHLDVEANAKLIAAAPDMYRALEEAWKLFSKNTTNLSPEEFSAVEEIERVLLLAQGTVKGE